ncbi:MAG TPA: serine hydrolase domain-containing protein [Longimicrobiales bacterium]|nr:serine hydrolase domain-containing protein [Longimicrobiales bacterium]
MSAVAAASVRHGGRVRRRSRLAAFAALGGCAALMGPAAGPVSGQIADRAALVAALDSAARAHAADSMIAGLSVAVVRGADTLLMRGYGYVDLEWQVPTPPAATASYEIGSVTKQFTAAAVLQLAEAGKLDLDADVTAYLPDFDTGGRRVPVRRLLDHTSGIKGYTEMPVFGELMRRKLPRDSLVTLIAAEPFDFEPGTALIYNNSAYFLLGLIIEKVSGQGYEEYVAEHLFEPLGMGSSYYCSESAIREGRAHGYDAGPDGLVRKGYLDHTWPYAAGSLCSTVGDLIAWNRALHHGGLLSESSYRMMTTPSPLEDGTPVRYAMGLMVDAPGGRRTITHGGGINGFLSDGRYHPDDDLMVVVLQNTAGPPGPGELGEALAELVLGPAPEPVATPFEGNLDELVGTYEGPARGRPLRMVVSRDGDALVFTRDGAPPGQAMRPTHVEGLAWEQGGTRLRFVREGGRITQLRYDHGGGHYVLRR